MIRFFILFLAGLLAGFLIGRYDFPDNKKIKEQYFDHGWDMACRSLGMAGKGQCVQIK